MENLSEEEYIKKEELAAKEYERERIEYRAKWAAEKKLEADIKMINEFMGYVQSDFPIHLHSANSGFSGSGVKGFIKKEQYDYLLKCFHANDFLSIDKFYDKENDSKNSYLFDGDITHLFLSAYRSRGTKLDHLSIKTKYNSSLDVLMPVLLKIESLGYRWEIGMSPLPSAYYCKIWSIGQVEEKSVIDSIYNAVVMFIEWYNNTQTLPLS